MNEKKIIDSSILADVDYDGERERETHLYPLIIINIDQMMMMMIHIQEMQFSSALPKWSVFVSWKYEKKTHLDSDYEWQWQWEFLFGKWKKQTFKLQHHENQVLMVLEPHFFQWKWNEKITKNYSTRTMCLLTLFDLSQLAMNHSAIIIFDDFCRAPIFPNGVIIIVINYWLVWQV